MSRSRKPVNPAAQQALNQLKEETAAEIGLANYANMNKATLTSAENGYVGGNMVKKMIQAQEQKLAGTTSQANSGSTLTAQYDINRK